MPALIAFEGTDGSGKQTQCDLLVKRLEKEGHAVKDFAFPDYDSPYGQLVKKYLSGGFPGITPHQAALLYALDRFQKKDELLEAKRMSVVVCDRYIHSNAAYQSAKLPTPEKRREFANWLLFVESVLPQPDCVIFLNLDPVVCAKLLEERGEKDDHEKELAYQQAVRKTYLELADDSWIIVDCAAGGELRSKKEIHEEIHFALKKRKII